MRVLLRLGGVELWRVVRGEHLGHRLADHLLLEDDRAVEVAAVAGHRGQVDSLLEELLRELASPVGPEVEVDRCVLRPEPGTGQDDGLDELVGHPTCVGGLDRRHRVSGLLALAGEDRRQRALGALPTLVAVHRVVAAADRDDPRPFGDQLGEVTARRRRRHVAPVGEGVDVRPLGHVLPACQLEERPQLVDVRVDAAVGDEAEQVDVAAALSGPAEGAEEGRVLEELTGLDRPVDAHEVLEGHAAGPDREVADLGVPHLPRREPDVLARRAQGRVGMARPEIVEDGRVRQLDRVPRAGRRTSPSVEDDERYERVRRAAVSQIAVKESTSSEAPPTSAPSTSSWERSSSAFSGFTEPP